MSTGERDPLDILINGELASREDLEMLDTLATDLLRTQSGFLVREFGFLTDDGAMMTMTSHVDEEEELPGSTVSLTLGGFDEYDSNFQVIFGYDGSLSLLGFDDEEGLKQAVDISNKLLESNVLIDIRARKIAEHLGRLAAFSCGKLPLEKLGNMGGGVHVADAARGFLADYAGQTIRHTEFGMPIGENADIHVVGQELYGEQEDCLVTQESPVLQIIFEDREKGTEYYYAKYQEDEGKSERELNVTPIALDEVFDNANETLEDEIEELLETTGMNEPTTNDVRLLIQHLVEASFIEMQS
jgi:hypothetical protein